MREEQMMSPSSEAPMPRVSLEHERFCHPLQCDLNENCVEFSTSPKGTRNAHKISFRNGIHFPIHFSLKKAKNFLHMHQEDVEDVSVTTQNLFEAFRDQPCDRSSSEDEDHLHAQGKDVEIRSGGAISKGNGCHKKGGKKRSSNLKSSLVNSHCDSLHHVEPAEAKVHPPSFGSSPKMTSCENITKPSAELVKAWHAFHQNKGHRFPQDWVRPVCPREYTHCHHDEEVVTHTYCDCCQKPQCERKHFLDNLVHPFHSLANIFGAHKEEFEHDEKFDEIDTYGTTFSSIFGQAEEIFPLISECCLMTDIFGEQHGSSELAELLNDFKFCNQICFETGEDCRKSYLTCSEELSWDLLSSSVFEESRSLLSIEGKTNEEILRLMSSSSAVKEVPRLVLSLAGLRHEESLKRRWKFDYCSEPSQTDPACTVPSAKSIESSSKTHERKS